MSLKQQIQRDVNYLEKKDCQCEICNKTFSSNGNLQIHKKHVHENSEKVKIHKCYLCQKSFYYQDHLDKHVKEVHVGSDELFHCEICKKGYKSEEKLKCHVKRAPQLTVSKKKSSIVQLVVKYLIHQVI